MDMFRPTRHIFSSRKQVMDVSRGASMPNSTPGDDILRSEMTGLLEMRTTEHAMI